MSRCAKTTHNEGKDFPLLFASSQTEDKKTFETVKTKAIAQLKNYLQRDEIIQNKELLKAMVLIFVKDGLFVEEVAV